MEQGGVLYWSELYPDVGQLDGSDHRNLLISAALKYKLLDEVFHPFGALIGFRFATWEEYDLEIHQMRLLLQFLHSRSSSDAEVFSWISRASLFVADALAQGKTLSLCL